MADDKDVTVLVNRLPDPIWECPHCHRKNELTDPCERFLEMFGAYKLRCSCCRIHTWKLIITDDFRAKMKDLFEDKRDQNGSEESSEDSDESTALEEDDGSMSHV